MIKTVTFSLLLFISLKAALAEDSTQVKLDLATAKRYAVEHNYGITALKHEVDEVKSRLERTNAPFLPKIGVAGGVEGDTSATASETSPVGYVYGSYNIFNGFRDVNKSKVAEQELEKSQLKLKTAEFLVGLEVEEYFHTYLYKKNLIELKDQSIAQNEEHQGFIKRSRAMGSISETDVMEFQLKSASLNSELVALKQELENSRSSIKRLLGEEIGSNIQPVGNLQHQHVKGSLMDYLAKIQESSQIVRTAALDLNIANTEKKITNARWLPEVDLEVRAGFLSPKDRLSKEAEPQTSIALVAKMDLYSGGDASWESREKIANALKVEAQLKDEINTSIRKVETAYRNLKVIEARADLEKDNVDFANRYYKSVVGEYQRGYKNSSDLNNAAEKLADAKVRKIELEYQFIKERIELEKALGAPVDIDVVTEERKEKEGGK